MITAMLRHSGSRCSRFSVRTRNVLLVERIRVARMPVLVRGRLQERDRGHVARGAACQNHVRSYRCFAWSVLPTIATDVGGRCMRVRGRREVLERVVVRHVVVKAQLVRRADRRRSRGRRPPSHGSSSTCRRRRARSPPWNHPHVTPARRQQVADVATRSARRACPREQTSQYGSVSLTNVPSVPLVGAGVRWTTTGPPHAGTAPYTDDLRSAQHAVVVAGCEVQRAARRLARHRREAVVAEREVLRVVPVARSPCCRRSSP